MSGFLAMIQAFGDLFAFGAALAELTKTVIERFIRSDIDRFTRSDIDRGEPFDE